MRNLILFFQRYNVFFLFLLLLVLSLGILLANNRFQRAAFLNASNQISGGIFEQVNQVRSYFNLQGENDRLREENALLKTKMRQSYYVDTVAAITINDSIYKQRYEYIPARVINNSINGKYNYITLNKGALHGIKKLQGVICADGVVGKVVNVSDHYCTVMSMLNLKMRINPKVESNLYYGSIDWDGNNPRFVQLKQINRFAQIDTGQMVYTSGFASSFPAHVAIGKIQDISLREGANFYDIQVELSTDFGALSSVYIVRNLYREEIDALEDQTTEADDE